MANVPATAEQIGEHVALPALVDRAAQALSGARTAAEVLEARELAGLAYDAAKRAARLTKAKGAHDQLIAAAHRAQADALEIEAGAKRRLADEYDAAQERGEVAKGSVRTDIVPDGNDVARPATAKEVGLSRKEIHDARTFRDAEKAQPGIVKKTTEQAISEGREPNRATVRRAVREAAGRIEPAKRPGQGKDAICARVKDAIMVLSGLPPAVQVAGWLRGTDLSILVDEHLTDAIRWLDEFAAAWGDEDDAQDQ